MTAFVLKTPPTLACNKKHTRRFSHKPVVFFKKMGLPKGYVYPSSISPGFKVYAYRLREAVAPGFLVRVIHDTPYGREWLVSLIMAQYEVCARTFNGVDVMDGYSAEFAYGLFPDDTTDAQLQNYISSMTEFHRQLQPPRSIMMRAPYGVDETRRPYHPSRL
jgi:hypothetical protein